MSNDVIKIRGARTHNLKDINVDIPQNQITCVAGPSGSGKTSLVFHTLLTESKRRFINSLPTDMKFFWEIPHTVDVDSIYPVLPAWGLPQHNPVINSRPAALDVLGGHERLQKLFLEMGSYLCPEHDVPYIKISSLAKTIENIRALKKLKDEDIIHVLIIGEDYKRYVSSEMFPNRSMNGSINLFNPDDPWYELIRVRKKNLSELSKKIGEFNLPAGILVKFFLPELKKSIDVLNNFEFKCPYCERQTDELRPHNIEVLSPLNALGACSECEGHGMILLFDPEKMARDQTLSIREGAINFLLFSHFAPMFSVFLKECKKNGIDVDVPFKELDQKKLWKFLYKGSGKYEGMDAYFDYLKSQRYKKNIRIYMRSMQSEVQCSVCEGTRVSEHAGSLSVLFDGHKISFKEFLKQNISESKFKLEEIKKYNESEIKRQKMENTFEKLLRLYRVAEDLGLGHLQNTRKVRSMSSSEYQRLLLSKYFSYEGSQSLFVLDEPSLGLSQNTQERMVKYLRLLRDQGNTVLMVEHSEYLKSIADQVIEMGPGAGERGGQILFQGKYEPKEIHFEKNILQVREKEFIRLQNAQIRNLFREEITVLKNAVNWVCGESGTGKSSFIIHLLANEIHKQIFGTRLSFEEYSFDALSGAESIKDIILINSGLDKISPRSTVGTFTELGGMVRKHFAGLEISKKMDLKEGHFSSNSKLGQCPSCEGRGVKLVEMHFMEDVEFVCEDCQGKKIRPFYASISDGQMTAFEALNSPLSEVLPRLKLTPKGKRLWQYFKILKLDYLSLDRTITSLSGGERQRLQLLSLLDKKVEGALIVFENLTSGLSRHEYAPLAELLQQLAGTQNTLIVIDQNPFFKLISNHQIVF